MNVYLDNGATTQLTNSVKKYLISILDNFGNPNRLYQKHDNLLRSLSTQTQKIFILPAVDQQVIL